MKSSDPFGRLKMLVCNCLRFTTHLGHAACVLEKFMPTRIVEIIMDERLGAIMIAELYERTKLN
jgi:hypothetical protein